MGCICTNIFDERIISYNFPDVTYERREKESHRVCYPQWCIHHHDWYEIYINLGDPVQYVAEEHIMELPFGGVVITPPGVQHYAYTGDGKIYHRMRLHLAPQVYETFAQYQVSLQELQTPSCRMAVLTEDPMQLVNAVENASKTASSSMYLSVIVAVMEVLLRIDRQMEKDKLWDKDVKRMPHLLWEILQYIHEDENYLRITSNREVAQKFYITESYLSRMFQQYMPLTAHKYLLGLKINYARTMLLKGSSVTEACYAVGFSDCSHFIAIYRQYTGETPGNTGRQHYSERPESPARANPEHPVGKKYSANPQK